MHQIPKTDEESEAKLVVVEEEPKAKLAINEGLLASTNG
jgi:hypothetical protein